MQLATRRAPEPRTVLRAARETADTFTLRLDAGFPFAPGQFNMLYAFGVGEAPISISGDPARPGELVHTIRAVGPVTSALVGLRRGDTLGVRGPFGAGWPLAEARGQDVLIVAGGLGLAPLRSVVYHVLGHRRDHGRLILLYGARTPGDLLFRRELERWRSRLDVEVMVAVDRAGPGWRGRVDVVPALVAGARADPARTVALVCGPEVMMRYTLHELQHAGLPSDRIYLSLERSMRCGVGLCGHCQLLPVFVCKDGPVFRHDRIARFLDVREA